MHSVVLDTTFWTICCAKNFEQSVVLKSMNKIFSTTDCSFRCARHNWMGKIPWLRIFQVFSRFRNFRSCIFVQMTSWELAMTARYEWTEKISSSFYLSNYLTSVTKRFDNHWKVLYLDFNIQWLLLEIFIAKTKLIYLSSTCISR